MVPIVEFELSFHAGGLPLARTMPVMLWFLPVVPVPLLPSSQREAHVCSSQTRKKPFSGHLYHGNLSWKERGEGKDGAVDPESCACGLPLPGSKSSVGTAPVFYNHVAYF